MEYCKGKWQVYTVLTLSRAVWFQGNRVARAEFAKVIPVRLRRSIASPLAGGPQLTNFRAMSIVRPTIANRLATEKGIGRMSFFPRDLAVPSLSPGRAIEWEEPSCLLCMSRNWSALVEAPDSAPGGTGLWFVVVQCQECGLCFTNPRPSPDCIGRFYPAAYRPHRIRRKKRAGLGSRLLHAWYQPLEEYQAFCPRGGGRLLD